MLQILLWLICRFTIFLFPSLFLYFVFNWLFLVSEDQSVAHSFETSFPFQRNHLRLPLPLSRGTLCIQHLSCFSHLTVSPSTITATARLQTLFPCSGFLNLWSGLDFNLCVRMPECIPKISPWRLYGNYKLTRLHSKSPTTNFLFFLRHAFLPLRPFHPCRHADSFFPQWLMVSLWPLLPQPGLSWPRFSSFRCSFRCVQWLSGVPGFSADFSSAAASFRPPSLAWWVSTAI